MGEIVLGIYGSPRKGGNTDRLLDKALEGAESAGGLTRTVFVRDLKIGGCTECGGCDKTGRCVIQDDMQKIYPLLEEADVIFLASPIFFYNLTSQVKALIDRSQAMWAKRLLGKTEEQRKRYSGGRGYILTLGATRGKNLFEGAELTAKYFFDAMDMSYEGGLFFRRIEKSSDIQKHPDLLEKAFRFGQKALMGKT